MTRLDVLPPDDSTPESHAWEEWAGRLKVGDRAEVIEGGYAGHRGRVEALDDDVVQLVLAGNTAAQTFHWHEIGPIEVVKRPTLFLTNLSSRKWHGPGRKVCAMANPRHFERGDGSCSALTPARADLEAVRACSIDLGTYRARFEARLKESRLEPHALRFDFGEEEILDDGSSPGAHLRDGDTVFCACARPGSPSRRTPCHMEICAPFLVRAGWDVMIDGMLVTMGNTGPVWAAGESALVMAGGMVPYRAEAFGWPEAT